MTKLHPHPAHYLANCRRDDPDCPGCFLCEGGLGLCLVCNGAESSLTSHCCQRRLTEKEQDAVSRGDLDFYRGEWVSPARWKQNRS